MFHFTIRDLLWLTLLVAIGLTWYGYTQHRAKEMATLVKQIEALQKETLHWRNSARAHEFAYKEYARLANETRRSQIQTTVQLERQIETLRNEIRSRDFPKVRYLLDAFEPKQ